MSDPGLQFGGIGGFQAQFNTFLQLLTKIVAALNASSVTSQAWTPTDASGASLVFSGVSAGWSQVGNMIFAYTTLTYPSTANGSNALLGGLPFTVPNIDYAAQGNLSYCNTSNCAFARAVKNTKDFALFNASGVAATNANMSTATLSAMIIYPAA